MAGANLNDVCRELGSSTLATEYNLNVGDKLKRAMDNRTELTNEVNNKLKSCPHGKGVYAALQYNYWATLSQQFHLCENTSTPMSSQLWCLAVSFSVL